MKICANCMELFHEDRHVTIGPLEPHAVRTPQGFLEEVSTAGLTRTETADLLAAREKLRAARERCDQTTTLLTPGRAPSVGPRSPPEELAAEEQICTRPITPEEGLQIAHSWVLEAARAEVTQGRPSPATRSPPAPRSDHRVHPLERIPE